MKAIVKKPGVTKPIVYENIDENNIIEEAAKILLDYGYFDKDSLEIHDYYGSIIFITDDGDEINLLNDLKYSDYKFVYVPEDEVNDGEEFEVYSDITEEYFDSELEALEYLIYMSDIF